MLHGNISFVLFQYLLWGVGDIPLAYRRRFLRGAATGKTHRVKMNHKSQITVSLLTKNLMNFLLYIYIIYILYIYIIFIQ